MNNVYIHNKKNNLNMYLISFILLIIYGFYKNGILLKEFGIINVLKPILIPLITFFVSSLCSKLTKRNIINNNLIYLLIFSLMIPVNINIIIYILIISLYSFLIYYVVDKFNLKFNIVALFKILLILIMLLFKEYNYMNLLEQSTKYSYDLIDIFFGRGISGICNSSIVIIVLSYILLSFNEYYKKDIPLICIGLYLFISFVLKLIFHKVIIMNAMIVYAFVYIAPLSKYTPVFKYKRYIYYIVVSVLSILFTYYINQYDGVIIAILIASLINYIDLKKLSNDI